MERQIATTKEQSDRLLQCGVSAYAADMTLSYCKGGFYELMATPFHYGCFNEEDAPAWSLSALLGLLPKRIKRGDCSDYTLNLSCDGCFWDLEYTYARYCGGDDSLVLFEYTDPIEVCIKAIEWLMDNGYKLNEQ